MDGNSWLEEINSLYRQYKKNCERAAAQVSDDDFFSSFGQSPHSIAVLMRRRCSQMTPWAWVVVYSLRYSPDSQTWQYTGTEQIEVRVFGLYPLKGPHKLFYAKELYCQLNGPPMANGFMLRMFLKLREKSSKYSQAGVS